MNQIRLGARTFDALSVFVGVCVCLCAHPHMCSKELELCKSLICWHRSTQPGPILLLFIAFPLSFSTFV